MNQMQQSPNVSALATEQTAQAIAGLVTSPYDEVLITYTDSTKATISTVVFKSASITVATITYTTPSSTQDRYVKT